MIPILFDADETSFTSNGIGRLLDAISCKVTEERNGVYELELIYPCNGVHYEDLRIGRIIYTTHDASKTPEPFDIYASSAEIDGKVTFSAHHVSYRLNTIVVLPFSRSGATLSTVMAAMKSNAITPVPFNFSTDKANTANFKLSVPKSVRQILAGEEGSFLDVYGSAEYRFQKFNVSCLASRGSDNGVSIRYGKNMQELNAESTAENRYSAVVPFWQNPETGELLMLPEYAVISGSLPFEDADLIYDDQDFIVTDNGTHINVGHTVIEYIPLDLSDQWQTQPTEAQLRAAAQERLEDSQAWETEENITVRFTLDDMELPPALNTVVLCDTVGVYYPAMGVELKKKVIKTVYDSLLDRYDSIELGFPRKSLFEAVTAKSSSAMQAYVKRGYLSDAVTNATAMITGGLGGNIVIGRDAAGKPEEILIMDTDDTATAVNVIRMNKNGIGFSNTGYSGPFVSAWTIDGNFVTSFIHSGRITSLSGDSYWDLDSNEFCIVNEVNQTKVILNSSGISFYNQEVQRVALNPTYWMGSYSGSNNTGTNMRVAAAGAYLSLGYQDVDNPGDSVSVLMVNNSLNPDDRAEKLLLFAALYSKYRMAVASNVWAKGAVISAKNIDTGAVWWKDCILMEYDEEAGGRIRFFWAKNDGTDNYYIKNIIICDPATGDVTYSGGTIAGKVLLSRTGAVNTGTSLLSGIYSDTEYGIIQNWNNGNLTLDALSGKLFLGYTSTAEVLIPSAYTGTTTSAANLNIVSGGKLSRYSSSSRRYKHDIRPLDDYRRILQIPVVSFVYNDGYIPETDQRYGLKVPGLIAEDVAAQYPIAAEKSNGQIEDWNIRYILPPMLGVLQEHDARIAALEAELAELRRTTA